MKFGEIRQNLRRGTEMWTGGPPENYGLGKRSLDFFIFFGGFHMEPSVKTKKMAPTRSRSQILRSGGLVRQDIMRFSFGNPVCGPDSLNCGF